VDDSAQEVKAKAAEATRAIRREIESLPTPLPPVKNSNDFVIMDLEKPTALYLFKEDFAADNKVQFNGRFRGRWTVKVHSALAVGGNTDAPRFEFVDEAQLNGPLGQNDLQVKFKPQKLSAQLDFGHHLVMTNYKWGTRHYVNTFLNPYVYLETDRALRNSLLGIGLMGYFNRVYRDNFRLNFFNKEDKLGWDMQYNALVRYSGFFFNCALGLTFTDALFFKDRKFMLGYDRNEVNANVEFFNRPGTFREWACDSLGLSLSYDFREKGLFGVYATKPFAALSLDPRVAAPSLDDVQFGYRNKLRNDLAFKTKFGLRGLASFFFNYRLRDGLNLHTSLLTNILNRDKKGFLELPFDFGLKLKLEN